MTDESQGLGMDEGSAAGDLAAVMNGLEAWQQLIQENTQQVIWSLLISAITNLAKVSTQVTQAIEQEQASSVTQVRDEGNKWVNTIMWAKQYILNILEPEQINPSTSPEDRGDSS